MAIIQNRLSTDPVIAPYIPPAGIDHTLNEDWEGGPIAVGNTAKGMNYQAWKLTFSVDRFVITPQVSGSPVEYLIGSDSKQCSFCFDQNARVSIAWVDTSDQGHLYWYNTDESQFVTTDFANPVWGLALTLDDKRARQTAANDILLFYTLPAAGEGHYILYHRRQRDRFTDIYILKDPVWPYIHKIGMNEGLRVQINLSTEAPA